MKTAASIDLLVTSKPTPAQTKKVLATLVKLGATDLIPMLLGDDQ